MIYVINCYSIEWMNEWMNEGYLGLGLALLFTNSKYTICKNSPVEKKTI